MDESNGQKMKVNCSLNSYTKKQTESEDEDNVEMLVRDIPKLFIIEKGLTVKYIIIY